MRSQSETLKEIRECLKELEGEMEAQASIRDRIDTDSKWSHWHDGVRFGLFVAIEHIKAELNRNPRWQPMKPAGVEAREKIKKLPRRSFYQS